MHLHFLDALLWAAGPVFNAALLYVLVRRGRTRKFPMLAIWCVFSILSTFALFLTFSSGSGHEYVIAYWASETVDALLQVGVVSEVARLVFAPITMSKRRAYQWIVSLVSGAFAASFLLVWWIHPATLTRAGVWEIRGELFTSLLVSEMFAAVLVTSQKWAMHWRSHVMSIGYGLMVWAVTTLVVGILHGYWGTEVHYLAIEYLRMFVYLGILSFWCVALWRDEPEKKQPSAEMQETLLHLSDKVSYDLAKALGTRGKEFR